MTIYCPQLNRKFTADPKKSLMDNLLEQGIPVASSCKGDAICGKCRMEFSEAEKLPRPTSLEKKALKNNQAQANERLSCQYFPDRDVTIFTGYW